MHQQITTSPSARRAACDIREMAGAYREGSSSLRPTLETLDADGDETIAGAIEAVCESRRAYGRPWACCVSPLSLSIHINGSRALAPAQKKHLLSILDDADLAGVVVRCLHDGAYVTEVPPDNSTG